MRSTHPEYRLASPKPPESSKSPAEDDESGDAVIVEEPSQAEIAFSNRELEEILDPAFLSLLSGSKDFSYVVIDETPPGMPDYVLGFTKPDTGQIFLVRKNAVHLLAEMNAEGGREQGKKKLQGFLIHEGGHHAPEVLALDQRLRAILGKSELEPNELQEYFNAEGDEGKTRELFWKAFWYDNCNGSLDEWLESFQSRGEFEASFGQNLMALHESSVAGRDFLKKMPAHHQLTQWLVGEEQYYKGNKRAKIRAQRVRELEQAASEMVDPEVAEALKSLRKDGVMQAIVDRTPFEYWGSNTGAEQQRCIDKKFKAVIEYVYPAWRKLLLLEFDKRKAAVKAMLTEIGETRTEDELKLIYQKVLRQLLDETQDMGKKAYSSETPGEGEGEKMEGVFKKIGGSGAGRGDQGPQPVSGPNNLDKAKASIGRGLGQVDARRITDLADRFGVSPESLRKLDNIEKTYAGEIQRLAENIAEAFLSQRRARVRMQLLEGRTTSGMEDIEFQEAWRGNQDSPTHELVEQATEFLQTEVEHLFDTSGSMQGQRLEYAQIVSVILTRAFERVKEMLEGEGLLRPEEEDPLRSGFTLFTTIPERIKKLSEPNKASTLAQMIEQTGKHSGGTDDAAAIKSLTTEMMLGEPNVLKFMMIYSDGEGHPDAVKNIMSAVAKDDSIIVIIVAMGANPQNVANTYETNIRTQGGKNIFIVQGNEVKVNLPALTEFLIKKISQKALELS